MRITYGPAADAACIYLAPRRPGMSKETIPMDIAGRAFAFDFGADGRLSYIEVLDASKVLPASVLKAASRPADP